MKRIYAILTTLIFLVIIPFATASALTFYQPDSGLVAWDPPAGAPAGITYRVYLAPLGNYEAKTMLGETTENNFLITFDSWGRYVIGVSAVMDAGQTDEIESAINWSDENGESTPNPFGYRVTYPPLNLRPGGG